MQLLFNLDVIEGSRVRARPSEYLRSLAPDEQARAVSEFLQWAEHEAANNSNPQARAETEIGIATAREFLQTLQANTPRSDSGKRPEEPRE
ncbi:MAG: hypothetical protein PVH54_01170 [Gammaproteobacteria bacterium]|jgi:hypothetical protein